MLPPPHAAAAGLLLWARQSGYIDRLLRGRRSAANASSVELEGSRGNRDSLLSIEILPIATQQCRNYLYDKS